MKCPEDILLFSVFPPAHLYFPANCTKPQIRQYRDEHVVFALQYNSFKSHAAVMFVNILTFQINFGAFIWGSCHEERKYNKCSQPQDNGIKKVLHWVLEAGTTVI